MARPAQERGRRRGRQRGSGHTGPVDSSTSEIEPTQERAPQPLNSNHQPLSQLLQMPHSQHKVSTIHSNGKFIFSAKSHRVQIPYHHKCETALKRLGLYHVAIAGHTNIDKGLITALVERWRPETHTFHLSVGEMTVTLQDVACLWGLPIDGIPVSGVSDWDWNEMVVKAFGLPVEDSTYFSKKKKGTDDYWTSRYSLSLHWLRDHFSSLSDTATPEEVDQYTRAYVMDLLGTVLFLDLSSMAVPAMYLQFIMNLEQQQSYNWGAAVLAYLYRSLSIAARSKSKSIGGPLKLLQIWSWTWLNVTRPRPLVPFTDWGEPDRDSCQPFGRYWSGKHVFANNSHHAGTEIPREDLNAIKDGHVNWLPYENVLDRMPTVVQRDRDLWLARVPLIHFWIVSYYYPDRVMRQFGLAQPIPPPAPLP